MSWIAWDKVLAGVVDGGLGVGSLKAQNLALLGKWWWRFKSNKKELWKNVITALYGNEGGFNAPSREKKKGFCWGTIVNLHNTLSKHELDFQNLFYNQSGGRFWKLEASSVYIVSSLRCYIDNKILPKSNNCWNWNCLVPGKVNILAWRVCHGRLPTKENLYKIGIGPNPLCALCNQHVESESHLFTTC